MKISVSMTAIETLLNRYLLQRSNILKKAFDIFVNVFMSSSVTILGLQSYVIILYHKIICL